MTADPATTGDGPAREHPRRIVIVGPWCSGKSTLAHRLGDGLLIPVTHVDRIGRDTPGAPISSEARKQALDAVAKTPAWIVEGGSPTLHRRTARRADLLVFIDLPRRRYMLNWVLRRVKYYGRRRVGMPDWHRQRLNLKSFRRVWNWPRDVRPKFLSLFDTLDGKRPIVLVRSHAEAEALARRLLEGAGDAAGPGVRS